MINLQKFRLEFDDGVEELLGVLHDSRVSHQIKFKSFLFIDNSSNKILNQSN